MEELFNKIAKANSEIKTINLKGKRYCEVKERVIAFRKVYPTGCIKTEIEQTENYIKAKAIVLSGYTMGINEETIEWQNNVLATGYARELANKPFALENAETSAIGRALGFCGFGISTSIASLEEMQNVDSPSGVFSDMPNKELLDKFNKLTNTQKANILNLCKTTDVKTIKADVLETLVNNAK